MVDILDFVGEVMQENEIPYEFGEWTQPVSYPYFVGTFDETDYSYEDNNSSGTLLIDGWARGSNAKLLLSEAVDKIKKVFANLQVVRGDRTFFIRYGGESPTPSGEDNLYRVTITLFTNEWEGEE